MFQYNRSVHKRRFTRINFISYYNIQAASVYPSICRGELLSYSRGLPVVCHTQSFILRLKTVHKYT